MVLGEVYQDLLFVLLALSFLEENRRSEGIRCAQKKLNFQQCINATLSVFTFKPCVSNLPRCSNYAGDATGTR